MHFEHQTKKQWKGLDKNPVTKLLFHMCGFISVQMAANGSGVPNDYDRSSFKAMLRETKKAFRDGFDVLVFPEGQLNPNPEAGLLPIFHGAFSLAKMSHRPIRMVALHGADRMWHADDNLLATEITGREVSIRGYPPGQACETKEEFETMFQAMVGHFGATGQDLSVDEREK
jgi:1-acyl-sn-glycerol-3-phosphate acyltransferase